MQDPRDIFTLKSKKIRKTANPVAVKVKLRPPSMHPKGPPSMHPKGLEREPVGGAKQKATPNKRGCKNVGSSHLSNTNSHLTGPGSAEDYRILRRKYLMLEEESFSVDKELAEADDEARVLEEEKSALLDQLVVLEGLVGSSVGGSSHGRK